MKTCSSGPASKSASTRAIRRVLLTLFALLAGLDGMHAQKVQSVFVAPLDSRTASQNGMTEDVRRKLIERLERSHAVQVTSNEAAASAVLRINPVIWATGTVTLNPRSQAGSFTTYEGYASAYLYGADGCGGSPAILWTYLATPGRFRVAGIVDDLSGQIATKLIDDVKAGLPTTVSNRKGPGLRVAGATFPAPLYLRWFQSFEHQPGGVAMTYDATGSVAGNAALAAGTVDMAASDIPASASAGGNMLRIPTVVGGIVPIYNVTGPGQDLNLTGDILADIYAGKIQQWDDPRILAVNHGTRLPHAAIAVVHRSDGSGTTFVWTSYLAQSSGQASAEWKTKVGTSVEWPAGIGVTGNEGMADQVSKTPNSIGYVELTYAIQHRLHYAAVRNPAGRYIKASLDTIASAADSVHDPSGGVLLNSAGKDAYPISTFTWLVVPQPIANPGKRASINAFLHWMLTSGQRQCSSLGYAPLPRELAAKELHELETLK